jgi:transcriptional regulator with XRE-family HTH domain
MTSTREQVLSEFIDAWNAGRRPDVDEYMARVPAEEQVALGEELATFLTLAPTPAYSDDALAAIRAEIGEVTEERGLLGALLRRLRERFGLSTSQVAGELAGELELAQQQVPKTAGYLEQLENGSLEPARVSRRVFEALGRLFGVPGTELEAAADRSGWMPIVAPAAAAAPVFRADEDAADRATRHLGVLADTLAAPGAAQRDEVDDLFMGGR